VHAESEKNGAGVGTQIPEETGTSSVPPAPEAGNNMVVAAGSAVAGVLLFGLTRVRIYVGKAGQPPRRHPQGRLRLTSQEMRRRELGDLGADSERAGRPGTTQYNGWTVMPPSASSGESADVD
jgi:hypothetical protein